MADRKPIVYVDGYPQELATGDRLVGVGAVTVSATQPSTATTGDLWLNSTTEILSVYDGSAWTEPNESESFVKVQGTVPASGISGQLWFDTASNQLYCHDGNGWETAEATTYVQATAPATPAAGNYWWDTTNLRLKILLSSTWTAVAPRFSSQASAPSTGVEAGDWWYNTTSGAFSMYIAGSVNAWTAVGGGSGSGGSINDILAFG